MEQQPIIDQHSAPADKIALFRAIFRGREDVYPRHFESRKTGRSGYSPACVNEWVRDLCNLPSRNALRQAGKRKVQCAECPHRGFLPVTDKVVRYHLSGQDATGRQFVVGFYPMLLDETCCFLAADFDKQHWREDIAAVLETCRQLGLPAALERSRSGQAASDGGWYYRLSSNGYALSGPDEFGQIGQPAPGDYDGDSKADPAIVSASGRWYF